MLHHFFLGILLVSVSHSRELNQIIIDVFRGAEIGLTELFRIFVFRQFSTNEKIRRDAVAFGQTIAIANTSMLVCIMLLYPFSKFRAEEILDYIFSVCKLFCKGLATNIFWILVILAIAYMPNFFYIAACKYKRRFFIKMVNLLITSL